MSEGKQKGKGLEDPFLDKADESGDTYKNGASNIFYAYARRVSRVACPKNALNPTRLNPLPDGQLLGIPVPADVR